MLICVYIAYACALAQTVPLLSRRLNGVFSSSGLEGASIAGPSYSGEGSSVSGQSARVVGESIAIPSSHSAEEQV